MSAYQPRKPKTSCALKGAICVDFASAATECLALAWLIGCLEPSVPVPAPFLTGPQGAGKSTGGRMLVRVIEGMSGDLRRAPKDEENMITAVAAGWVLRRGDLALLRLMRLSAQGAAEGALVRSLR